MVNEANPLDEFLRHAEKSASFPVNEDHWKQMERRLDEDESNKKRRLFPFWWKSGLFVLLTVGMGILAWQFSSHKKTEIATQAISLVQTNSAPEQKTNTANETKMNEGASSPEVQEKITLNKTTPLEPSENNKTTSTFSMPKQSTSPKKTKRMAMENHKALSFKPLVKQTSQAIQSTKNDVVFDNNKVDTKTKIEQKTLTSSPATLLPEPDAQWVRGKAMQAVDTEVQWRRSAMSEEEMIRYNPRYQAHLKQYQSEKNDSITIIRFKPVPVNSPESTASLVTTDSINASFRLHLMLGTMFWRGFVGGDTWSPAPYLGLGLEKQISPRITMASQVGFTFFSGLQTHNRTVSYRYKFGLDSTVYTALHRMVFRVQWPIQFRYAFNKQHALLAGVGAAWQPDGISRVTAPTQVLNGGNAPLPNSPVVSKNTLGFLHGIRTWDFFLQAAYQWQWHERMALQVLWQAGLRDMTDNKILSSNRIQRNNGLMIGLRYSFVRSNR